MAYTPNSSAITSGQLGLATQYNNLRTDVLGATGHPHDGTAAGGFLLIKRGLFSARPAFGNIGTFYFAYDTGEIWRDNGTGWDLLVPGTTGMFTSRAGLTRWSFPGWCSGGLIADPEHVCTAHAIYFVPILVRTPITFDKLGIYLHTEGAGGALARVGLYSAEMASSGLVPNDLIDQSGALDVNAPAGPRAIEVTISEALCGWYFTAFVTNSAAASFTDYLNTTNGYLALTPTSGQISSLAELPPVAVGLRTDVNAGADWPTNGLPASAPAVTSRTLYAFVLLRDSS